MLSSCNQLKMQLISFGTARLLACMKPMPKRTHAINNNQIIQYSNKQGKNSSRSSVDYTSRTRQSPKRPRKDISNQQVLCMYMYTQTHIDANLFFISYSHQSLQKAVSWQQVCASSNSEKVSTSFFLKSIQVFKFQDKN